jgi:hypothetical protein
MPKKPPNTPEMTDEKKHFKQLTDQERAAIARLIASEGKYESIIPWLAFGF